MNKSGMDFKPEGEGLIVKQYAPPPQGEKKGKKVGWFRILFVTGYVAFTVWTLFFRKDPETEALLKRAEALAEANRMAAEQVAETERRPSVIRSLSVEVPPIEQAGKKAPSTNMLRQAVKGNTVEDGQEDQILDYGAQVEAYKAQVKAQEDAQKAKEEAQRKQMEAQLAAQKRTEADMQKRQEALLEQQRKQQQQIEQWQQQQQRISSSGGTSGRRTGTMTPKPVQQPKKTEKKSTDTEKKEQQTTQINKLETRKIF